MIGEDLTALARGAIESRIFPGCVLGLTDNRGQDVRAFGKPTYESESRVDERSIYDVAYAAAYSPPPGSPLAAACACSMLRCEIYVRFLKSLVSGRVKCEPHIQIQREDDAPKYIRQKITRVAAVNSYFKIQATWR